MCVGVCLKHPTYVGVEPADVGPEVVARVLVHAPEVPQHHEERVHGDSVHPASGQHEGHHVGEDDLQNEVNR